LVLPTSPPFPYTTLFRSVLIEAYRESGRAVIDVEDAGSGVPPENRAQIFECFFTTEPDGTGLGLPIARRLAAMNDGELTLAARPDRKSTRLNSSHQIISY